MKKYFGYTKTNFSLWILWSLYLLLSIVVLFSWTAQHRYQIIGDEPHYLIITHSLHEYHSLEVTKAYEENLATGIVFSQKNKHPDLPLSEEDTHGYYGPHGLFSLHNIGLPLLLYFPFIIAGIIGAKLFMIFVNSFVILLTWKISSLFSQKQKTRFIATLAACIGLPFIPAANQLFPDLLAGTIILGGLYWALTIYKKRSIFIEMFLCSGIAFLPWLHLKFSLSSGLLLIGVCIFSYRHHRNIHRLLVYSLIMLASITALAGYNTYAFGHLSGPYVPEQSLKYNATSLMVFLGLFLDQNQGFIFQNPISLFGFFWLSKLYARYKMKTIWAGIIFLSLLIPNASHVNWYGGHSFSGRFGWSAVSIFLIATVFGIIQALKSRSTIVRTTISLLMTWQIYLFYRYGFQGLILYQRPDTSSLHSYSLFYGKISHVMPAFYNSTWAYDYWPNYFWLASITIMILYGSRKKRFTTINHYE